MNLLTLFKTNLHPIHTQKTCLFQIFLLIAILSFLKPPEKQFQCHYTRGGILLGFYDSWSFETPRINNHCVPVLSDMIVLGCYSAQSFETPPSKTTVSLHQVPSFLKDIIHWNFNTRTELIGQFRNYFHPEKSIFFSNGW